VSDADFRSDFGGAVAAGQSVSMIFWWVEDANSSNYQDVSIAVSNWVDNYNSVPTLSISGFGTSRGMVRGDDDLRILHWRTLTNNLKAGEDAPAVLFNFNMIQIPSGS
jgi:hypothetical protein